MDTLKLPALRQAQDRRRGFAPLHTPFLRNLLESRRLVRCSSFSRVFVARASPAHFARLSAGDIIVLVIGVRRHTYCLARHRMRLRDAEQGTE